MTGLTRAIDTTPVYVTRIQQTQMPGYNRLWFRCSGCDLQGDMTGTENEVDEVLTVLGEAHATRHGASTMPVPLGTASDGAKQAENDAMKRGQT